jgi:hypothetical protein
MDTHNQNPRCPPDPLLGGILTAYNINKQLPGENIDMKTINELILKL